MKINSIYNESIKCDDKTSGCKTNSGIWDWHIFKNIEYL